MREWYVKDDLIIRLFKEEAHQVWGEYILKNGTEIRVAKYRIYKEDGDKIYLKQAKVIPRYLKINNRVIMESTFKFAFTKILYYGSWYPLD